MMDFKAQFFQKNPQRTFLLNKGPELPETNPPRECADLHGFCIVRPLLQEHGVGLFAVGRAQAVTICEMLQKKSLMARFLPNEKKAMIFCQMVDFYFFFFGSLGAFCQLVRIQQQGFEDVGASFHSPLLRQRNRSLEDLHGASSVNHNGVHMDRKPFLLR